MEDKIQLDCNTLGLCSRMSYMCQTVKVGECFDMQPQLPVGPEEFQKTISNSVEEPLQEAKFYKTSMWRQGMSL